MGGNIAKNKKEEIPKYREKTPCYENRELSWLKFNERVLCLLYTSPSPRD